ncbi:MAG: SGNH/GDSL hydrolase family protein [Xanthobacteraceae bacterium]
MADAPRPCNTHLDLVDFKFPLPHLAQSLKRQRKTRIVAIGSSSTAGEGNIIPYPARLELALRGHSYGRMVDVLNRGFGGQEAPEELSRFESDVIGEAAALVIWQVGTNAVFHDEVYSPDAVGAAIAAGLDWLAGLPIDVVLMDLQYTMAIVKPEKIKRAQDIQSRIEAATGAARVNLFRRFALMERWVVQDGIPIEELIDPTDGERLHMSDWATNCMSQALFGAIAGGLDAVA